MPPSFSYHVSFLNNSILSQVVLKGGGGGGGMLGYLDT
jgi:hypothetical protein